MCHINLRFTYLLKDWQTTMHCRVLLSCDVLYCKAWSCDHTSSVCLSVCLSVTLVDQDHTCWKSWKLIARTLSTTPSLFAARRPSTCSQGNMRKFGGDYRLLMTPPTIHEKISLVIIIVWSSKFPARKNICKRIFFKPVYTDWIE